MKQSPAKFKATYWDTHPKKGFEWKHWHSLTCSGSAVPHYSNRRIHEKLERSPGRGAAVVGFIGCHVYWKHGHKCAKKLSSSTYLIKWVRVNREMLKHILYLFYWIGVWLESYGHFFCGRLFLSIFSGHVREREDTLKKNKTKNQKNQPQSICNLPKQLSFIALWSTTQSLSPLGKILQIFPPPSCKLTFLLRAAGSFPSGCSLQGHFWKATGARKCSSHLPAKPCVHAWAWILDNVGDSFSLSLALW